ncbi:MAG: type III pantothenate kinase [Actinomycetia bacterium]|nr:type III pantothenate kinase [Actinomycetes bacterium]
MLLTVDIGNTQTVIGLFDGAELRAHWRVATLLTDTADTLAVQLKQLFALDQLDYEAVSAVTYCCVVPALAEPWRKAALRISGTEAWGIRGGMEVGGLSIALANPYEIGADRIADAVAAVALYGAPVIVVDFGTATNIEVIDKDACFVGGIIAPGLATSAQALFKAAARLSNISIEVPKKVIGKNTQQAVRSGLTYGEIDRIDGLVQRVFDELGYRPYVVATGGLSAQVSALSRYIDVVNNNLTLQGLRLLYEQQHQIGAS